jgi:error-prone DNA polymerase
MSYVELQTTTNFSFLRGASHPQELVGAAYDAGHPAIGIADRNSMAGVVRAWTHANYLAKEAGIHPPRVLVGARLVFGCGAP